MAGTFLKWLIPGVVTVAAGTALALAQTGAPLATDLESRATAAITGSDYGWSAVRIDGRDAIVSGTATTQKMIDDVMARVAEVHGVRAVSADVVLAEFVSPFPFSATTVNGATILSGGYPSEDVHGAILADAPGASDTTRLLSGAPDARIFQAGAAFGLSALKLLDQGEIKLADLSLSVTGRAKSTEAFGEAQALRNTVPAGITLASLTVVPPLASPYVWTATFDGATVSLVGNIPAADLEDRLRAVAPANIAVSTGLTLASGEPAGFASNALELLKTLLTLEQGEVNITGDKVTLMGAPQSSAVADAVVASVAKMGGTATLEPPRVADYALTVDKTADALIFAGFVPDTASRDKLAALKGADVSGLTLARGAPERFASAVDFGLEALGHLQDGRFELKGTRLTIGGRAGSVAEFKAASAMIAEGAPQGLSLATAELKPPFAKPFRFSASKSDAGATTLTGYLPDEPTRAALLKQIARLDKDNTDPADGAPDNFAFLAGKGLEVLSLLDSGSVTFDGANWAIDGVVDSPRKGFAADASYSAAGLRTLGWSYKVRLPSLPIISPYVWRAQKAGSNISVTGFSPTDEFKGLVKTSAPNSLDASVLGAGSPEDFEASALAGLEALLALDEGSLGLSGTRWSLTGDVADAKARDAIQTALSSKVNAANWLITIQARDSAPAVTPYLWSATRSADGNMDLGGYLPSESLKAIVTVRAGSIGRDTTVIASGEPAGFSDDLFAGLDALSRLGEGKAYFDGSKWVLTGTAATQADGEAAMAALLKGSRGGSLWTSAISGYLPPAAASSEPTSSEQPSSSEALSSSEASSEPSMQPAPSSEAMSSTEAMSSAEAISSEPASSEPSSSEPVPSSEPPSSSEASSSEEPVAERSIEMVDPLPPNLIFEASRTLSGPVSLKGGVPEAATAEFFGVLAGGVPTDNLLPQTGLPDDFMSSASMGLNVLLRLNEGRLGFDGSKWWLRGKTETSELAEALTANIGTLPNAADWSVSIDQLPPIDICRDRVTALALRNAIVFESGSATLTKGSLPVIDELAQDLGICADASVHVEGHTDADGAEDINLALSVARAETVVEALIERGVAVERLYAEGYGESQPIASNDTKEGKAQNRRIVFSISKE